LFIDNYIINALILFSVRRTDRSNAKFATSSWGETDNARRRRAADILPRSLSAAELVSRTTLQPLTQFPDLPHRQSTSWWD